MEVLPKTSLRDGAARALRASIVAGELEPGEIYSAVSLAELLGVSPTPVREAMLDLAHAGLVEAVRHRGFRVLTVADRDLDEISQLRLMLEVPALESVIAKATDDQLAELDEPLGRIEAAADAGDLPVFLVADHDFHLALLGLAGNQRLVRLVGHLRDQTRLPGLRALAKSGGLDESAREHRPILDAVKARDVELSQQLMRAHLEHTRGMWAGRREAPARSGRSTQD